jgi:hypothetical protein
VPKLKVQSFKTIEAEEPTKTFEVLKLGDDVPVKRKN